MSVPFAAVVTPDSIVFTSPDGKTHTVSSDHTSFSEIKDLVRKMSVVTAMERRGENINHLEYPYEIMERLMMLVAPAVMIEQKGEGKVTVENGLVLYEGTPVHTVLADRILWGLGEGFEMSPYIKFLENLMRNPSKRAVDQLFMFIERHKMGITEDGYILAYKRVREDYKDIFSGKMDNSPGQIVTMPRNQVNDDPNQTCSTGLHFCSQSYLGSYGRGVGSKIVIVKVDPADVVSVPTDYDAAKVRCCRYEVLGEYEGSDKDDLLKSRAVFRDSDFQPDTDDTREFDVGDMVKCIDGGGLGQTDILMGVVYRVDGVSYDYDHDKDYIYIGPTQGVGRYYDAKRFQLVDDDDYPVEDDEDDGSEYEYDLSEDGYDEDEPADPAPDPAEGNDASEYDRAYEFGYVRGYEAPPGSLAFIPPDSSEEYHAGFLAGWRDGAHAWTVQQPQDPSPTPVEDTATMVAPDSGSEPPQWVEDVQESDVPELWLEDVQETTLEPTEPSPIMVPVEPQPDVRLPPVEPVHDPISSAVNIVFDAKAGGFTLK